MSDLLDALAVRGVNARRVVATAIWVGFAAAMIAIAAVQAVLERSVGATTLEITGDVVLVWAAWTLWHSYLFGRHRHQYLRSDIEPPYRRAFIRDIFPGITIGFSQMLRPAWNGANLAAGRIFPRVAHGAAARMAQLLGVAIFGGSFLLFAFAWRALGASRVGFVYEFRDPQEFEVVRQGPYSRVRHPLFWSGVGVSWSLALITGTTTAIMIAVVNTGYGLVYNVLEDRRFDLVLGERYRQYSNEVPRIIPARRSTRPGHGSPQAVPPSRRP